MSLESTGEFVLEFLADTEARRRVDATYLQALSEIAAEKGYDFHPADLAAALRLANLPSEGEAGYDTADPSSTVGDRASRSPFSPLTVDR